MLSGQRRKPKRSVVESALNLRKLIFTPLIEDGETHQPTYLLHARLSALSMQLVPDFA